jgi:hypothetical protein
MAIAVYSQAKFRLKKMMLPCPTGKKVDGEQEEIRSNPGKMQARHQHSYGFSLPWLGLIENLQNLG